MDSIKNIDRDKKALASRLERVLEENKDKRVVVVGTTCTGKTTLLKNIKGAYDMDELVFPLLTKEERDYVCQTPWTPEIGETMTRLVKERVVVKKGMPVFGTIVLDSDLVIYLDISDELLQKRVALRNASFDDAKNMQRQIKRDIEARGIPIEVFFVG